MALPGEWRGGWVEASALGGIGAAFAVVPVLGPCGLGLPTGLLGGLAYGLVTGAVLADAPPPPPPDTAASRPPG